jgi:hypothetical protein
MSDVRHRREPVEHADEGRARGAPRSALRSVAVPTEHGGWGLTAEPALLGLLIAPSLAGVALGAVALLAFVARTPLRMVLVDVRRGRSLPRTRVAGGVLAVEATVLVALAVIAVALTSAAWFWWPAVVAAPLVMLELWFDMRSRSRRLAPELAGAVGIGSIAAMIVLAGGESAAFAIGAWLILASRAITSIPHVRAQIGRLHGRSTPRSLLVRADLTAMAIAVSAVLVDLAFVAGGLAIGGIILVQRASAGRPLPPPKILGLRQMALGLALVAVTAAGTHI